MALHHAEPGEIVDLQPLGSKIKEAKSAALIKSEHFETIRLIVRAGEEMPPHEVPGSITLHCLEGRVKLELDSSSIELKVNEWVWLDGGEVHSVKGIEDSCLLLTIILVYQKSS